MSKIIAMYDTETKALSLEIDGVMQPQAQSVMFDRYVENEGGEESVYGYFNANFKGMKNNDVSYRLSASASEIEKSDPVEEFAREVLTKTKKV